MSAPRSTTRLRELFERPTTTVLPMGTVPLHAQMAQAAGYEAFWLSGGFSAWWDGFTDVGLLTQTEVLAHAAKFVRATDLPIFCDADTGYGSAINVQRTIEEFIRLGVAGVHLEDQAEPKKAGGTKGIRLADDDEAIGRLRAACEVRDALDPDFVIVARTDGYGAAGGSLKEAVRRGNLYLAETGADVVFYEGLQSWDQARQALRETNGRAFVLTSPSARPAPTVEQMSAMGQAITVFPFIQPGVHEVWRALLDGKDRGEPAWMDEYNERIEALKGTRYHLAFGELARPSYATIRHVEETFLPPHQRPDYEGSLHSDQ
ncbi:isocitrate lyase/PEP mutase family protein [Streptomyces cavernae]|uniref:isocitrate lyase/PEP mutase family protein n=1 Tax=Streptomyces cavernae TaxID=2259034 RepID=UPI000FEB849E|nr:isocitrate lyase/PEP mutase family protein [Streptomyces cavernae]